MIGPGYAQTMAAYGAEMNRRVYGAASSLSDAERRADRGAFWRSIHGTLSHLLWADRVWMARLAGWTKPAQTLRESDRVEDDFAALTRLRFAMDADLAAWTADLDEDWLSGSLAWHSAAAGRDMTASRALILMHLFNHQTHHRGQVHAMLTAAGRSTGDTDIPLVLPNGL